MAPRGVRIGFNTNGTLLTRQRAERLILAGLGWLCISLDGATVATFEGVREGASFERVEENVRGLVDAKHELGANRPDLSLVFVAMRRNVHELPDLVRLAARWGISNVRVQNLSHSFSDTDPAGSYREIRAFAAAEALWQDPSDETPRSAFRKAREAAMQLGVVLRLPELRGPNRPRREGSPGCGWPWTEAYITHDGKVEPCCMVMGSARATLGDLNAQDFASIWHGEPYRVFRKALLTAHPPDVCVGCSLYRGVF